MQASTNRYILCAMLPSTGTAIAFRPSLTNTEVRWLRWRRNKVARVGDPGYIG